MTSSTLTGTEIVQVLGQDNNGQPAATLNGTNAFNLSQVNDFGARCTTALALTTSATLTQVPGMIVNVIKGAQYVFNVYLSLSASAGGGIAVNLGQGSTTAATFTADTWIYNTTTVAAQGNTTALTSNLTTLTGLATALETFGSFTATSSGTLAVFAAQNVGGNASTTTINVGSFLQVQRVA